MNINELTANAESTIGILENIAGYEPSDIDGDTVELRFEDESGCDTGCDVSIVEQCQNAADVIRALTDALEAAQAQSSKWLEAYHKAVSIGARYEERIAELEEIATDYGMKFQRAQDDLKKMALMQSDEARTLTVKLPAACADDEYFIDGVFQPMRYERDVERALLAAGIKLQIEGE